MKKQVSNPFARCAVLLLEGYHKWISPALPQACRFTPTCSQYASQAIQAKGLCKGGVMAFKRVIKCHPFHPGGYDPIK